MRQALEALAWVIVAGCASIVSLMVVTFATGAFRSLRPRGYPGPAVDPKDMLPPARREPARAATTPPIEEHPVWSMKPPPPPTPEESMGRVLAMGAALRACVGCGSQKTTLDLVDWSWVDGDLAALVHQCCSDCPHDSTYHLAPDYFVAADAMRVWEAARTARATLVFMQQNIDEQAGLEDLGN